MSVTRRALIAAGAATGLATCADTVTNAKPARSLTFMLVHGTWHGGWVWRDMKAYLEGLGHKVYTPTLTGCGEREHLSTPEIGLETHITDLTQVMKFEDLTDVILVGHSFSGVAITGAADRMKSRIKHICFFDALVPRSGRMSGAPRKANGSLEDYFLKRKAGFIDGYKMDYFADYPIKMLLPENHPKAEWVKSHLTTHPSKAWTDELSLSNGGWEGLSRSYIHATGQAFAMTSEKMIGPARSGGWDFVSLDVPRNGMVTHPKLLADTILERAGS